MTEMFESEDAERPIRQGDVFCWANESYQRPWKTYGLVVTADCDLARNKTKGILSYIPALVTEDYLWNFWLDGKFDNLLNETIKKVTSRINNRLAKISERKREISSDAALFWIERSGVYGLAKELEITDNGQISDLRKILNQLSSLKSIISKSEPDLELLRDCYLIKTIKGGLSVEEAIISDFQSSISNLPGDVFHLPHTVGNRNESIFFMLRYVSQCRISDVGLRPDDIKYGDAKARRIGRVSSLYRYAMMQNFAKVFTDIGLPEDYPTKCRENVSGLFDKGNTQ